MPVPGAVLAGAAGPLPWPLDHVVRVRGAFVRVRQPFATVRESFVLLPASLVLLRKSVVRLRESFAPPPTSPTRVRECAVPVAERSVLSRDDVTACTASSGAVRGCVACPAGPDRPVRERAARRGARLMRISERAVRSPVRGARGAGRFAVAHEPAVARGGGVVGRTERAGVARGDVAWSLDPLRQTPESPDGALRWFERA